ncbi:MAG: hypothetical protein JW922_00005, partial [Paludibacteraceae bacterium]|nr:hypothetical protein [Paludibacteraceae bacterium]
TGLKKGSNSSTYGFNGKEMDNEVSGTGNQYDYGFRIYNPRLGKFLSVDPLTSSYPWYTPYQFAGNGPVWAIDLDGLESQVVIYYPEDAEQIRNEYQKVLNSDDIFGAQWELYDLIVAYTYTYYDEEKTYAADSYIDMQILGVQVEYNCEVIANLDMVTPDIPWPKSRTDYIMQMNMKQQYTHPIFGTRIDPQMGWSIHDTRRAISLRLTEDIGLPAAQTLAGTTAGGMLSIGSASFGFFGNGLISFSRDAIEQVFNSNFESWNISSSIFSGTIGAFTAGKDIGLLNEYLIDLSGNALKSTIKLNLDLKDMSLNPNFKIDAGSIKDMGLRSTVGFGLKQVPATGAFEKRTRSIILSNF